MSDGAERAGGRLELAATVRALREEIEEAQAAARGESITFTLQRVELEAQVQVSREKEGRGGVKFYVVEAGGAATRTDATMQRVTLSLVPTRPTTISESGRPE